LLEIRNGFRYATAYIAGVTYNAKQYIGAYTEPAHKNPDKIRIWREKVAENPDLPKWNGYANTNYRSYIGQMASPINKQCL